MNPTLLRKLSRLVWIQIGNSRNPWFASAMSSSSDPTPGKLWSNWNQTQLELCQALHPVVFDNAEPDEQLVEKALAFLEI